MFILSSLARFHWTISFLNFLVEILGIHCAFFVEFKLVVFSKIDGVNLIFGEFLAGKIPFHLWETFGRKQAKYDLDERRRLLHVLIGWPRATQSSHTSWHNTSICHQRNNLFLLDNFHSQQGTSNYSDISTIHHRTNSLCQQETLQPSLQK